MMPTTRDLYLTAALALRNYVDAYDAYVDALDALRKKKRNGTEGNAASAKAEAKSRRKEACEAVVTLGERDTATSMLAFLSVLSASDMRHLADTFERVAPMEGL